MCQWFEMSGFREELSSKWVEQSSGTSEIQIWYQMEQREDSAGQRSEEYGQVGSGNGGARVSGARGA